jgi:signal transduction histidine kinase
MPFDSWAIAGEGDLEACTAGLRDGRLAGFVRVPLQQPELLQAVHLALRQRALGHGQAGGVGPHPSSAELEKFRNDALMIAAHDIRSPLSVMVGYANVMLDSEDGLSERGRRIADRIQVTGSRLLQMVDRILDFAAFESGREELQPEPTRLSELVQEAMDSLAGLVEEKRITVSVDVSGDDTTYLLDQNRVLQVLQNLLSNAVKFSEEGGRVSLTCQGTPGEITFSVGDAGIGLTPEQQAHVFEKFARVSTERRQGSGLGLAIAKSVAELHGGRIWVESEPGRGSTFYFTVIPETG